MSAVGVGTGPQSAESSGTVAGGESDDVTVVIPARDRAALLTETLRSVREQTEPVSVVIVCDDGSTEDVGSVARSAGAVHLRNERGGWGAAGARNAGLTAAETPFVWFLDSDDLLLPNAVKRLRRALATTANAPFAYGQALHAARQGGWHPRDLIATCPDERSDPLGCLYVRNSVPASCALVRTADAREIGGFDADARFSQDHLFWIRLAQRGGPVYVDEPIGVYRRHAGTRHAPLAALRDNLRIAEIGEADPRLASRRPERNGVLLVETVSDALHLRRPATALRMLWELLLGRPNRLATIGAAIRHARRRRRAHRRGIALWADRADLRAWLEGYR